jgi:hypothetical protein
MPSALSTSTRNNVNDMNYTKQTEETKKKGCRREGKGKNERKYKQIKELEKGARETKKVDKEGEKDKNKKIYMRKIRRKGSD